jgi:hypothetical protein
MTKNFKILVVIFALMLFTGIRNHVCSAEESAGLFNDFPGDTATLRLSPTVVRSRLVTVNFDLIQRKDVSADTIKVAQSLNLNLFPDIAFVAILGRLENNPSGSYSWIGHLEGNPFSTVTLVVNDNIIMGNITLGDKLYAVRFSGEFKTHVIQEIDSTRFPRD